jgi:tRNA (guanine-N7-)-methyltransferase
VRGVRSYVRREGRITAAQLRALREHSGRYTLPEPATPLDLDAVFGRRAPRLLEIGCGAGEVLVAMAQAQPEQDFIAAEVYRPGIGRLLSELVAKGCANVRVVQANAATLVEHGLQPGALDAVCVFFPDPWPKKRHHKRRLLQPHMFAHLRRVLAEHGRLYVATDSAEYAAEIGAGADAAGFINLAGFRAIAPRPAWRTETRFERKARIAARTVVDFVFGRPT